jgi:hypothetical protein
MLVHGKNDKGNNNSMISSVRATALSAFEAPNFKAWSRFRPQDQVARLM